MIALARIRRAAAELKGEGAEITIKALAQKAGCTYAEMMLYIQGVSGLKNEIGLCTDRTHFEKYQRAVQSIRARNKLVTRQSLAYELRKNVRAVGQELLRHPTWITALGLKSYGEASMEMRRKSYVGAVIELYRSNERISCCAIARICEKDRTRVSHDLNSIFSLAEIKAEALVQLGKPLQAAE